MSKITLISASRHIYKGQLVLTGESFEVDTQTDADDLVALHFATYPEAGVSTKVMKATNSQPVGVKPATPTKMTTRPGRVRLSSEGSYQRRDLVAEE